MKEKSGCRTLFLVAVCLFAAGAGVPLSAEPLDWELINLEGFGNTNNFSAFSVAEFNGVLYVGTHNITQGCEIWRFDGPTASDWTAVSGANGFGDSQNQIAYSMAVFNGLLYVGARNNSSAGLEIWSYDGADWTFVQDGAGLGDSDLKIPASMVVFGGNLILGTGNSWTNDKAKIFRFNGTSWAQMNTDSFGDTQNRQCRILAEYGGALYAGTYNNQGGGQVWRYDGPTSNDWTQVAVGGFGEGPDNLDVRSLCSFSGKLFAGTANTATGCQIWEYNGVVWIRNDPGASLYFDAARVMITVGSTLFLGTGNALGDGGNDPGAQVWQYSDSTGWEQINQNGFDDPHNMAAQFLIHHEGYLYAGVSNSWGRGATVWRTEVEDDSMLLDFGDAPDPGYPTLRASDGAYHVRDGITFLGAFADGELDGQPDADATGDDYEGVDDEDGLSFTSALDIDQVATMNAMASVTGTLNGWIDFNADGDWMDSGEQVFIDRSLAAGINGISFDVPADATVGSTFARFRFSSATGLAPNGGAPDGEVEDYGVEIVCSNVHGCFVDLALVKDDGRDAAVPGEGVSYIITATNLGPGDAMGALVSDIVPHELTGVVWTCTASGSAACGNPSGLDDINEIVDLPYGDSVVFVLFGTIDPTATGLLTNTATISPPSDQTELDWNDNSATDTDVLVLSTDLSVTVDDGVSEAVPGESVVYTIVAANAGPNAASGAQVVDHFPPEIVSVRWECDGTHGGGSCTETWGTGDLETMVDLPVGTFVTFTVGVGLDPAATGVLANVASVYSPARSRGDDRGDPNPGDNTAIDVDTLTPEADLKITKINGAGFAVQGRPISYDIVVTNPGPSDAPGAIVIDVFPADLTGVEWGCVGVGCTNPWGMDVIDEMVDLPAGNSVVFTATATVEPDATGILENTASVSCPEGVTERNAGDNTASATGLIYILVFEDGFELGDTSGWSVVMP